VFNYQHPHNSTYHDNDKIQPAPSICKVLLEPKSKPLDQHLNEEDDGEDTIHVIQDVLQHGSLGKVYIFKSLKNVDINLMFN
jgi:hypothetical protein